jgi:excisionase family DNA binding protein
MDDDGTPRIKAREAAARLGVAVREVYRLIEAGDLPAYKVGRDLRLRTADLDALRTPGPDA